MLEPFGRHPSGPHGTNVSGPEHVALLNAAFGRPIAWRLFELPGARSMAQPAFRMKQCVSPNRAMTPRDFAATSAGVPSATTEHVSGGEDDGHAGIPEPVYRPRRRVCAPSHFPTGAAHAERRTAPTPDGRGHCRCPSPRPGRAHHGSDVCLGRGGAGGAAGGLG